MVESINPTDFLNDIYNLAKETERYDLDKEQLKWIKDIVEHEEVSKGVFTVTVTSLTYKCLHPNQDIRIHQKGMKNGYSGRTFDTKYVTPFLKNKGFYGAMKESGWLTRSLEQDAIYDLNFPGKIRGKTLKKSFLNVLNDVEINGANPYNYLLSLMSLSIKEKNKKDIELINPITPESNVVISDILYYLNKHFYYKYNSRGASILPVIALYSIYEILMNELNRFHDKKLHELGSHNSSDKSSKEAGDIVVVNNNDEMYEVVEVKYEIPIDPIMVMDCYKKIKSTNIQRYYILSTDDNPIDSEKINNEIEKIRKEHGCQIIINGVFPTLKYYLRLIKNPDEFLVKYINNLENDIEINYEHKKAWNNIIKDANNNTV